MLRVRCAYAASVSTRGTLCKIHRSQPSVAVEQSRVFFTRTELFFCVG